MQQTVVLFELMCKGSLTDRASVTTDGLGNVSMIESLVCRQAKWADIFHEAEA